jgi:hypothetical protein
MGERSGRRLDKSVIAADGLAFGALALGTALLLQASVSTEGVGPTAATLSAAFSALFGGAIGLAAGGASVAFAVRTGPRILSGLIAGLLGYALLAPTLIATAPSDVSVSESISTAAQPAAATHRGLELRPPDRRDGLNPPPTATARTPQVRRCDLLGGLLQEYELAA